MKDEKDKNKSAVELGKISAKVRLGGLTKKQRAEKMRPVWQKSLIKRGIKSPLLTKAQSTGDVNRG